MRAISNPLYSQSMPFPADRVPSLTLESLQATLEEIRAWPGYAPTPLLDLDRLASELGLQSVLLKDESERFGLASFKALGGAYAVLQQLQRWLAVRHKMLNVTSDALRSGAFNQLTRGLTVTCATDGNHGRSVAWGARSFGCSAVIFVHETVSQGRIDAIRNFGAEVRIVPGNYDDAVRAAARVAMDNDWVVVSDTSYPGYETIPCDVMRGYMVQAHEIHAQLDRRPLPTHIFVQAGVGGWAAAIESYNWQVWGPDRPKLVVVEPESANCVYLSVELGRRSSVDGDLDTIMAGLACGEPSLVAWSILEPSIWRAVTIDDELVRLAMREAAAGAYGPSFVSGESGAAGVAALKAACSDFAIRSLLELDAKSRVLLLSSEGRTDNALYDSIVNVTQSEGY